MLPRRAALQLVGGAGVGGASRGGAAEPGRLLVDDRGVALDLRLEEDDGFEARCANGRQHV